MSIYDIVVKERENKQMPKKMRCSQCKQKHIDFSDTIKLDKDGNPYNNACHPISIDILMINARMESKLRRFINKIMRNWSK